MKPSKPTKSTKTTTKKKKGLAIKTKVRSGGIATSPGGKQA